MSPRRVRLLALLAPIAAAALTLLAWTQTWVETTIEGGRPVTAAGEVAAPALPALALATLALAAALALAGPVFRALLGVLLSLLGAAIVTSAALALGDPVGAAAAAVTAASGVDGEESVRAIVEGVALTPWPSVGLAAGILAAIAGVGIAATSRRWPERVRRYDAIRTAPADAAASTSANGADGSTADGAGAPADTVPDARSGGTTASGRAAEAADDGSAARTDRLDAWDALSDGRDPTAG